VLNDMAVPLCAMLVQRALAAVKSCLIAHDLIRKPVPTFRDHALKRTA